MDIDGDASPCIARSRNEDSKPRTEFLSPELKTNNYPRRRNDITRPPTIPKELKQSEVKF